MKKFFDLFLESPGIIYFILGFIFHAFFDFLDSLSWSKVLSKSDEASPDYEEGE